MGNFINTTYKDTMDYIVSASSDIIKNPLYIFNDKNQLIVDANSILQNDNLKLTLTNDFSKSFSGTYEQNGVDSILQYEKISG